MEQQMDRFNKCLSESITAYRLCTYSDENMPSNDENVYQSGFEAGWNACNESSQSVIENASKLNWEDIGIYGGYGTYLNVCRAHKPLGDFLIRQWYQPKDIELYFLDKDTKGGFKSVEEAKKYANEMYKNEIKKVLGL